MTDPFVPLPIRLPTITECWDCTGCGKCCRGNIVPLDDADLKRLREQRWENHPDFRGIRTILRQGWLRPRYRLAQKPDGSCVFLSAQGLCRIHQEFGFSSKPLVCRMYPLQLVPLETSALLTFRRSCPTAAAEVGRPAGEYREQVKAFARERPRLIEPVAPPAIMGRHRRSWPDTLIVADGLARMLCDERYPLVRRLVHGLKYCELLEACRLRRLDSSQLRELTRILETDAPRDAGEFFRDRRPPGRAAGILFRQVVADYLRLHPAYVTQASWGQRWRLIGAAWGFARGGEVPRLHPGFPATTFAAIEQRPLGPLEAAVLRPLTRYFEASAASQQYAVASRPGWPLIEKYRALALALPVTLWMLRYLCGDRAPEAQDMIDIITTIDRGQGFAALSSRSHRRRVAHLADLKSLAPLVAWYAR